MSWTLRFILEQALKQWLIGRKRGKMETQKFKYLENEKCFLDEIKNIFQFLKGYHFVKNKNLLKNSWATKKIFHYRFPKPFLNSIFFFNLFILLKTSYLHLVPKDLYKKKNSYFLKFLMHVFKYVFQS